MSKGNILLSTSITTPNTSDAMSANIIPMSFIQTRDILPNTFTTAKGLVNSKTIEEYIKQSQHNNLELIIVNGDEVLGINLWQYANKLYEISQKHTNNDTKTEEAIQAIEHSIAEIKNVLQQSKTQYKNVFQANTLDGIEIGITQHVFSNSKKQIQELLEDINKAKANAKILANNETNKMLTMLVGANVYLSHGSIVLYFANKYLSRGVLLWVIRICFGISPQGAALFLVFIALSSIYKLVTKDDTLKIKIYEFYCVLNAILRQVHYRDGAINALVNFNQNISGNVIVFDERALKYLTSPLSSHIDSLIDPSMLDKAIIYNIDLTNIQPQTRNNINISITSLLKQSNLIVQSSQNNKKRLFAFSTFPNIQAKNLGDNDIINTSAFKHLKNIATQFSNFLFIQSPNLTSTLTLDLILQSFKVSHQNDNPINNKSILIVTNPLEVTSPHYKIYEYMKSQCNSTIQYNVVFLNVVNRIEKKTLFDRFKTIILKNYKYVETAYNEKYYIKEKIYLDKADKVDTLLTNFCNNPDKKDILSIANEFSAISELILEQKHLFDEGFYKEVARVEQYCKTMLDTLFAFEQILSCFIDFRIKQDKNNQLDEKNLETLRNKVREQINNQNTELSQTAICISHIINNAYFSNTPNNEIQHLNTLLENFKNNDSYQKYKKIIEQYQSYPKEQKFSNTINIFIPFYKDIFLEFFSKDDFEELCKFMLYLIDLETGGVFLYYTYTWSLQSKQVVNISKQDLQKIVTKDLWEKFQNFNEDKIIEYLTDHIHNKFAAYLAELSIKDMRDTLEKNAQNNRYESTTMRENIIKNITTRGNINRLEKLIKVMEDYNKKNTEEKLNIVIQSFQEIQKIENIQKIPTSSSEIKNMLQHSLKSSTTRASSIVFGLSKNFTKKALTPLMIFEIYTWILDQIFPTISKEDLTRQITLFILGMRGKKDSEYAKWEKGKPYFYIPKDLHKSLVIGDFMHSLLLDSSLDMGYCIHNPSIGAYTKNEDVAQKHFKDMIRNNLYTYNSSYFDNAQENESTQIYKEAHIKVHSYIDNIQSQNTHTTQLTQTNFQNLINKKLTQTKLKYQNPQNNIAYQQVGETTNSQRDFLIQLKRVAEYSYRVYKGERVLNSDPIMTAKTKDSVNESILSNFVYNESFIPTKIDIHKEL